MHLLRSEVLDLDHTQWESPSQATCHPSDGRLTRVQPGDGGCGPHRSYPFPCSPVQTGKNVRSSPCGKCSSSSCWQSVLTWLTGTYVAPWHLKSVTDTWRTVCRN